MDSWIDIEGGIGNLFANASLRRKFPNESYFVDGETVGLSKGGTFIGHHIMVPKEGIAVHINAFNFPDLGDVGEMCCQLAGGCACTCEARYHHLLPHGSDGARNHRFRAFCQKEPCSLVCGSAGDMLDHVMSQDVVTFTGSATTGRMLKAHPRIINESVPFNMEADSLNCTVLGEDAVPGTEEFDLFIKEVRKEMTVKCGQKCTAIRRIIVPENLVEDVQIALGQQLAKTTIGDPTVQGVRMGALAGKVQVAEVRERVEELAKTAEIVYGDLDNFEVVGADREKGAFMMPYFDAGK